MKRTPQQKLKGNTLMKTANEVMQCSTALLEEVGAAQDRKLAKSERAKATSNTTGYVAKLEAAGVGVAFFDRAFKQIEFGTRQAALIALFAKVRMDLGQAAKVASHGAISTAT